ncbi:MliC family protein [Pseudoxanthomonas suwonensis]|uniref:MliC family protein n=1 Tax=Pseudoxanthomonas suwonensis TaxID=314722 RepID=UPI000695A536|nr:MliC family protein [Pseudoxanthomonas suwonensis]
MSAAAKSVRPACVRLGGALLVLAALGACRPAEPEPPVAAPAAGGGTEVAAAPSPGLDAAPVVHPGAPIETQWQCDDQRVAARYDPVAQTMTLIHDRGQLTLPQAVSASGARYADDNGNEFWGRGDSATLTLSGTPARECGRVDNGSAASG